MSSVYKIKVKGCLSCRFSKWFNNLEVKQLNDNETLMQGKIEDQSALYGIIFKLRDLGLNLTYLEKIEESSGLPADPPRRITKAGSSED